MRTRPPRHEEGLPLNWPTLRDGFDRYELRLWLFERDHLLPTVPYVEVRFIDHYDAQNLLLRLMTDPANRGALRAFAAGDFVWSNAGRGLEDADEHQLAEAMALAIDHQELRVLRIEESLRELPLRKEPPVERLPLARPASTWVEVKVVWDDTGEPVGDLPVVIEPPGGRWSMLPTKLDGNIRLEPVDPGSCEVRCTFRSLTRDECVAFIGMGEGNGVARAATPATNGQDQVSRPGARPKAIVLLETRKVRSGETLESIAQEVGLEWEELAVFNWGTKEPEEVNEHLAAEVGCAAKTTDGKNYVFDESDRPGVILVPRQWKQPGLATRRQHIVRVGPVTGGTIHLRFDACDEAAAQRSFRLFSTDGSYEQTKTAADDAKLEGGAEKLDLNFSGCPAHLLYSLRISGADASPEMYFENVPYEDLTGAVAQQAPREDPPAAKEGNEEEGGSRSQG